MIQLANRVLSNANSLELDKLQDQVDKIPLFKQRVAKAQSLWNTKGGIKGKKAFEDISKALYELCIYTGVCNYCEQSEANDIEHIYPKSYFPETAFKWDNYLLACKQCNSGFKLDACHILNDTDDIIILKRGDEPSHKTIAFINPRTEDPNQFMLLNPLSFKFEILPGLSKKDTHKADCTLQILELNTRDILLQARKSAGRYYYETLSRLVTILQTTTLPELTAVLSPYDDRFDLSQPINDIKNSIKASYRKHLSSYQHPSVWYTIKLVQSRTDPKWQALFAQIPEAVNW